MSDLAYNINGEAFDVPATATAWRVRRMKQRGAPEVVYGREGVPLIISIESDLDELRRNVATPGRFRLDAIDDRGRTIEDTPAAYVVVASLEPAAHTETPAPVAPMTRDNVVAEAMRLNTELAKSVIDRFPEMMHAAAELLRAADGAGLPARQPRERAEDYEDDHEEVAPTPGVGIDINAIIAQVVPMLVMAFASGDKSKLPSLAEMLDWRKAVPKTRELAAAPIDVAPASAPTDSKLATASGDAMERVGAVLAELTSDERMLAIAMAQELSADERAAWFAELAPLSVSDAVARLRKVLSGKKERVS